ncbi:hypothetical protein [Erwinia sp. OPT-41]|uniref:Uncharacterized protein n=1 Tax=Erwinia plantamica TaxID=3237104 RepID=A0ABW7CPK7_9GAMM
MLTVDECLNSATVIVNVGKDMEIKNGKVIFAARQARPRAGESALPFWQGEAVLIHQQS